MNYWIFKSSNCEASDKSSFKAADGYRLRMKYQMWGLKTVKDNQAKMPYVHALKPGDRIVFYLTGDHKSFAGTATIEETILSEEDRRTLNRESVFLGVDSGVRLTEINEWENLIPAKDLARSLRFIKNEDNWGQYLQGQITRLEHAEDYKFILDKAGK